MIFVCILVSACIALLQGASIARHGFVHDPRLEALLSSNRMQRCSAMTPADKYGCESLDNMLAFSTASSEHEMVDYLFRKGASPWENERIDSLFDHVTAMDLAIEFGNRRAVDLFLTDPVPNYDYDVKTIKIAAWNGHVDVLRALLKVPVWPVINAEVLFTIGMANEHQKFTNSILAYALLATKASTHEINRVLSMSRLHPTLAYEYRRELSKRR